MFRGGKSLPAGGESSERGAGFCGGSWCIVIYPDAYVRKPADAVAVAAHHRSEIVHWEGAEPVELRVAHDTPASSVARNCGGLRCLVTCSNA
jgi:hypothetical protein